MSVYGLIKACLLFPAIHFVLMGMGALVRFKWPKAGQLIFYMALLLLFLCTTPFLEQHLAKPLQIYPNFNQNMITPKAQAIVVLNSPGTIHEQQRRLAWVAKLHHQQNIPIIVSGKGGAKPLAARLEHFFHVPVSYIDNESHNTWDHAQMLTPYLQKEHIEHFYLVASSWHMKRALWAFRHYHWDPIPVVLSDPAKKPLYRWIPNARSLVYANYAYYENMGLLWYRLKAWSNQYA